MNCIVPFEKDIKFDTPVAEICSISLEHEINVNDRSLLGNFILSGDYKTHEVSVNKDKFNFILPFDVAIPQDIDTSTLKFEIDNFVYELIDDNTLKVSIEFLINAQENSVQSDNTDRLIDDSIDTPAEDIEKDDDNRIINTDIIKTSDEEFVNYRIHIVKTGETIDSICAKYGILESLLLIYNDITQLNKGDKLIIPPDE